MTFLSLPLCSANQIASVSVSTHAHRAGVTWEGGLSSSTPEEEEVWRRRRCRGGGGVVEEEVSAAVV